MTNLVSKIENLLITGALDTICSATVVYLAMDGDNLGIYNDVRDLADRAVTSALTKINDTNRRMKVLEILPQMQIGYKNVVGLKTMKVLHMDRESVPDRSREKIEENLNMLKTKLEHPVLETDTNLYASLRRKLESISSSDLTWKDPEGSMVLSDDSEIVNGLRPSHKCTFLEPRENMKCILPGSVVSKCAEFMENFNGSSVSRYMGNILHNKEWKENEPELVKAVERILAVLGEIWSNPAFSSSRSRNDQSEGTYITDVVVPLLRASLGGLPNGYACLSTAERQSLASKARRNIGVDEERMGKKPDVMMLVEYREKITELLYAECSRILCTKTKKADDRVKLWRETLDGLSLVGATCRPMANQFGVVGIQVAGTVIHLNVLVKDAGGIPRYFHLDQAEIPLTFSTQQRVNSLVHLLLTLRNIMIVNKSLLMQALELADTLPPRNVQQSPTVSSPPHNH